MKNRNVQDKAAHDTQALPEATTSKKQSRWQTPICWTTGTKRVKTCEVAPNKEKPIALPWSVHLKAQALTAAIKDKEWLGYLTGLEREAHYQVTGIVIPIQEVTGGSVVVLEPTDQPNVIGTLHLHPFGGDGLFFSGTDDTYIGGNHILTIVTNNEAKYKGQVKRTLPCGASMLIDSEVFVLTPTEKGLDKFVADSLGKITEPPPVQSYQPYGDFGVSGGYVHYCSACLKEVLPAEAKWFLGLRYCPECWTKLSGRGQTKPKTYYCADCQKEIKLEQARWYDGKWYCPECYAKQPTQLGNTTEKIVEAEFKEVP